MASSKALLMTQLIVDTDVTDREFMPEDTLGAVGEMHLTVK